MPEYYRGEEGFGNLAIPDIYAADDAIALYPRGTRLVMGNRVLFYGTYQGKISGKGTSVTATNGDDLFGKFLFSYAYQQDMANALLVRKVANELSIVYNTTVSDAKSDDYYSGGWVTGKDTAPADERFFSRRIVAHEYGAYGSATELIWNDSTKSFTEVDLSAYQYCSVLELDRPVINSKSGMATTIMQEPYKLVAWQYDDANAHYAQCIGACMHNDPTATRHCWFQTYGEMFCGHFSSEAEGAGEAERVVMLMADGSTQIRSANYDYNTTSYRYPVIGYVMGDTAYNAATPGTPEDEGLPMIFVTLRAF